MTPRGILLYVATMYVSLNAIMWVRIYAELGRTKELSAIEFSVTSFIVSAAIGYVVHRRIVSERRHDCVKGHSPC